MKRDINNILVIGHRNIGDILQNLSVLKPLKKSFPHSTVFFVTSPHGVELLKGNPYVSKTFIYRKDFKNKFKRIFHVLELILKLRAVKFDIIINLKSGSYLHFFLRKKNTWRISSLNQKDETKRIKHAIDSYLDVLEEKKLIFSRNDIDMRIVTDATEKNKVNMLLKSCGYDFKKKIVVFIPFANWSAKEWSLLYYGELAKRITTQCGYQVVFVGGADDRHKINAVEAYKSYFIDFVGKLSLRELSALYERTYVAIGGDTGPFHLACNMNVIPLCLFGATSYKRARPYFHPDNIVICEKDIGCNPCYPGKKPHECKIYHDMTPCMKEIQQDKVFQKFLQVTQ